MLLEAEAHSDEEPINSDNEINSKVLEEELSQSPALSDNSRHLRVSVSRLDSVREPESLTTDVIISENLATDVIIPNDAHKSVRFCITIFNSYVLSMFLGRKSCTANGICSERSNKFTIQRYHRF